MKPWLLFFLLALAAAAGAAEPDPWQAVCREKGDPAIGKLLYEQNCMLCHGAQGRGDGLQARYLRSKPMNFTDPKRMRGETDQDMFHDILGGAGKEMPAWKEKLQPMQVKHILAHLRVLQRAGAPKKSVQDR